VTNNKKLIILKSTKNHFWKSCQIIEEQMLLALNKSDLDITFLELEENFSEDQLNWIKKYAEEDLHFFFLSDILVYQDICKRIKELNLRSTRYYFPIYGNMTVEIYRWLLLEKILKDQDVVFLGASTRSCQQIDKFINHGAVYHLPFCFETSSRTNDQSKTIDLVYAGRITPQKNIFELISAFKYAFDFNPSIRLHIAGDFHLRMFHLHGYSIDALKFQQTFNELIVHPGIIFHGNLDQSALSALFSRSDYFVSMSTYHDEDFGMSACQAACHGMGLILSDWGGHGDFLKNSKFVPVEVDSFNLPKITSGALIKILAGLTANSHKTSKDYYQRYFSHQLFHKKLKTLMTKAPVPYQGQSSLFHEYAHKALKGSPFHNPEQESELRNFYLSIYESYLLDFIDQKKSNSFLAIMSPDHLGIP
jgi:glycosyltransferase involved in cell wall biosynthesis